MPLAPPADAAEAVAQVEREGLARCSPSLITSRPQAIWRGTMAWSASRPAAAIAASSTASPRARRT
ncbi:hypothetical protein [Caldovatus aquaticus]|uniref:Uncharacterized protein n=1 Tax=Caldovatus aquaticus TaxID=2865671 RepID=A0ABS7F3C8_9PROT|nr:hypothetical protein [Caldovatus aquaticus]MBW8270038.1 hypothetical protein [Caldovatus aquaticus]